MTDLRSSNAVPHMSFSQMSMYLRCSQQWLFRYGMGLKIPPNLKMITGSAGHKGLEMNNKHVIVTGSPADTETVLAVASDTFDKLVQDVPDRDATAEGKSKDGVLSTLELYQKTHAHTIKTTEVEREFLIDVGAPLPVLGFTDVETNRSIFDYKVTSRAKSQDDADISPQLTLYQMAAKTMKPIVGFISLIPGGPRSAPRIVTTTRNIFLTTEVARLRRFSRLRYQFRMVAEATAAGTFIPTDDPRTCSWCGYRNRCQLAAVSELSAVEIRAVTEPDDTVEEDD